MAMSAQDVIDRGEYLNDNFDPASLKIPHLLSIFTFHGIKYPSQHTKAKLVVLFNEEVKPRAPKFRKERIERENSEASDRGITDGVTGKLLGDPDSPDHETTIRRSTRRASRNVSIEPVSPTPDAPKRRRASATPSTSRVKAKATPASAPVHEESEPEEEEEPQRKAARRTNNSRPSSKTRNAAGKSAEQSAWEDNNIFQSGAESSSPPKSTTKRVRKPRGSVAPASELIASSSTSNVPSSSEFKPRLAGDPAGGLRHMSPPPEKIRLLSSPAGKSRVEEADKAEPESDYDAEEEPEESYDSVVSRKIGKLGEDLSAPHERRALVRRLKPSRGTASNMLKLLYAIFLTISFTTLGLYKMESSSIGYCDSGANTNIIVVRQEATSRLASECRTRLLSAKDSSSEVTPHEDDECSSLSLILRPHPTTCTPCPARAICNNGGMICPKPLILKPHTLSQIPLLSKIADGLPGLGSVAFPPGCVEDRAWLKTVGVVAQRLEGFLAKIRGEKICLGYKEEGPEAKAWGIEKSQLRDQVKKKLGSRYNEAQMEDTFRKAMRDLESHGLITIGADGGKEYVASLRADMSLKCKAVVGSREAWNEWRGHLYTLVATIIGLYLGKLKLASNRIESTRVASLVQDALVTLRRQEIAHHTDPVTAPYPYLSSLHLRDLVLQDEHSIPARKRLWEKVERVVEGNANVRANLEDVNGDETRVWRWVGGGPVERRLQVEEKEGKVIA